MNWYCPACGLEHVTNEVRPHTPFHSCRSLKGLTAPFVVDGTKAKIEVVERGDYVNGDRVQTDGEGRPVMSLITTRDDGQDCTVFAPAATGTGEAS